MKEDKPFIEKIADCQDRFLRFFKIDMILEADLEDDAHDITRPEIQTFR